MIGGYSGGKVIDTWVMCMIENVLDIIIIKNNKNINGE